MTHFYSIRSNSLHKRGMPWIEDILSGLQELGECRGCGGLLIDPEGSLVARLERNKADVWPDAIGCGAHPLFVVSQRAVDDWRREGVGEFPHYPIRFVGPFPKNLEGTAPPEYVWLDGSQMLGARFDFEASGFVGVTFCEVCGGRSDDISATYDKQRSGVWPYAFVEGTWNGANLFTTDLSPCAFFCTDAVLESARRNRRLNFRFTPAEAGKATWSKGINYLGKKWPVHHRLRPSEGKTLEEWLEELRSAKPFKRYDAFVALLDLGKELEPAVPTLMEMLDDEDKQLRGYATELLGVLWEAGVPLEPRAAAAVEDREREVRERGYR